MGASGPRLSAGLPARGAAGPAAAARLAVRADLVDLPRGTPVAVAVSGGPDSLALLYAAVAAAAPLGLPLGALTVDHGWHARSGEVAAAVAAAARAAGCDPVEVAHVRDAGPPPGDGPEADARRLRYALLDAAVTRHGLGVVLLGHTMDDQAETVLLALARGSGSRSLSGMPARRGPYRRPLLGLRRDLVRRALPELAAAAGPLPAGLPWQDPANTDRRHARARVRADALPVLETALGTGAVAGLARSAALLRQDADALDALAAEVVRGLPPGAPADTGLAGLTDLPEAVLARVLRSLATRAGAGPLTAAHTRALLDLARAPSGSGAGPISLPGGLAARRSRGRLLLGPATHAPAAPDDPKEQ
ncbi:MAG: tRNA lysidine(34) synthetase TilS [Kineosporiaceae bacterium]